MSIFDTGSPAALFTAVAAGAVAKVVAGAMLRKPKQYQYVGKVGEIWLFPVKSFWGIPIQEAEVGPFGLNYEGVGDRYWVVTNAEGKFMCMRRYPKMCLIRPTLCGEEIELNAPGMEPVRFPVNPELKSSNVKEIVVWGEKVRSLDMGDEVGKWLSQYFQKEGVRMFYAEESLDKRDTVNVAKAWKTGVKKGDLYTYADACSYMFLSQASVNILNTKLKKPVPATNFRPNVIIHDCEAFAEDTWSSIRIGDAELRGLDPCTRCIMPTVDQTKGEKDKDGEPFNTLKTFRLFEPYDKPIFGYNFAYDKGGIIRVGDPVYALPL